MAIVTLDGVISGAQSAQQISVATTPTLIAQQPLSTWGLVTSGNGAAGTWDNSTDGGVTLSSSSANVAGSAALHFDPAAGRNSYLANLSVVMAQPGILQLCDRLLSCGYNHAGTTALLASATAPTFGAAAAGTVTLPARDALGGTNGVGVLAGLEMTATASTSSATSLVVTYTNSAGTGSKTGTCFDKLTSTNPPKGTFYRFPLAAGDLGVKSVQSYALQSTMGSGACSVVLYRVLAQVPVVAANVPAVIDALTGGFPQLQNGVVPFFIFIPTTTTASTIFGNYQETQG